MNAIAMSPPGIWSFEIGTLVSFGLASVSLLLSTVSGRRSLKAGPLQQMLIRIARGLATLALLPAAMILISTTCRVLVSPKYFSLYERSIDNATWMFEIYAPIGFLFLLAVNAWILATNRLKRVTESSGDPNQET